MEQFSMDTNAQLNCFFHGLLITEEKKQLFQKLSEITILFTINAIRVSDDIKNFDYFAPNKTDSKMTTKLTFINEYFYQFY